MRLNYREVLPDALKAMLGLERAANHGLDDPRLLDLIKIRASQINGCANCLRLHAGEARAAGETDERLEMIAVWRKADCFGQAERAALAWCEALTLLPDSGAPDGVYDELSPGERQQRRAEGVGATGEAASAPAPAAAALRRPSHFTR